MASQRAIVASQRTVDDCLRKSKEDVAKAQEDAMERAIKRAIKRARREQPMEFKKKGHQEQFSFNTDVADHVEATARKYRSSPTLKRRRKR